ncbi:ribulose-5-phosphate 4-epimerase [Longilinea arvoryzae]|uniref:Ribulose-5-phosphate 4-epimerase n=1 Tax=Longilinea arvoryzae TaxID=360412 RepID=A0A0S7BGA9_9CHLR|nr:class II aldolase/adducin family protein [Longilinea arvoryzae]GAP12741.1 ribulose-5-phosphate 4-epimerase [Longilinea arvoryzae]
MGNYDAFKKQVVDTAQDLTRKGYLMATGGNLSVRIPGQNAFAITPSDYDYFKMTPDDVCVLDFDLKRLEGRLKPSVESAMHAAVYQVRADVNAIVHTHQVYASALTLIQAPIPALFDEQTRFLGRSVEIIPYVPSGTGLLKNTVAKHIRNHNNAFMMQNHGALVFGTDMERAAHNVEILEKCSLAYLLAICSERKVSKVPLAVREIAFAKLRKDQERVAKNALEASGE